jgi:putative Holliday junction resolvase
VSVAAGVDYGRRRIGLAVSDPLGITARGLPTVAGDPDHAVAADRVATALEAERVDRVVVGLPLHTSGDESDMSREVRAFAAALAARMAAEILFVDEGHSSWDAEQALKARRIDLERARREGLIDQEAARRILLSWLAMA